MRCLQIPGPRQGKEWQRGRLTLSQEELQGGIYSVQLVLVGIAAPVQLADLRAVVSDHRCTGLIELAGCQREHSVKISEPVTQCELLLFVSVTQIRSEGVCFTLGVKGGIAPTGGLGIEPADLPLVGVEQSDFHERHCCRSRR